MSDRHRDDAPRLDQAARAGWLYYVAGNNQEEIAAKLGTSRQTAQRLVSLSVSAGLVRVTLEHPIVACQEAEEALSARYGLRVCEVVPSDPNAASTTLGIDGACAEAMRRRLSAPDPIVMAVGTGRTMKAAVKRLPRMVCEHHRIVSLTANIAPDGSASIYNVIFSMAEQVRAPHYPMPLPLVVTSPDERALLDAQPVIRHTKALAAKADATFVGVGELGHGAPLVQDAYITEAERADLVAAGAVGEIVGWVFDGSGRLLDCAHNQRVASAPIPDIASGEVVAVAMGKAKRAAIQAALSGGLVNGLITDECTAAALLRS